MPAGGSGDEKEEEHHNIHMPSPSYLPMVTSIGLCIFGYGLIYSFVASGIGVFITMVGLYAWAMEPATAPEE